MSKAAKLFFFFLSFTEVQLTKNYLLKTYFSSDQLDEKSVCMYIHIHMYVMYTDIFICNSYAYIY